MVIGLGLLAVAASVVWVMAPGSGRSVLVLKSTGTNSVFVRTWPPRKLPRFAFTVRTRPLMAKPVPLNAVILNRGCVVTQEFARGARIEVCAPIPSVSGLEVVPRPDGALLTDGYSRATSNLQFRVVWQGNVRRIEAEVNGDGSTNLFRVIKVVE